MAATRHAPGGPAGAGAPGRRGPSRPGGRCRADRGWSAGSGRCSREPGVWPAMPKKGWMPRTTRMQSSGEHGQDHPLDLGPEQGDESQHQRQGAGVESRLDHEAPGEVTGQEGGEEVHGLDVDLTPRSRRQVRGVVQQLEEGDDGDGGQRRAQHQGQRRRPPPVVGPCRPRPAAGTVRPGRRRPWRPPHRPVTGGRAG